MSDWLSDAVRREGAAMFSEHPPSEQIVLFAEAPGELSAAQVTAIEDHVRVCGVCADDVARLHAAQHELTHGATPRPAESRRSWSRRLAAWFAPARWVPAVAVGLAAIIWIETSDRGAMPEPPLARSVGDAVMLRSEIERGAVNAATPGADGRLTLMFDLPAAGAEPIHRCDVTILTGSGEVVAEVPGAKAIDEFGTFILSVDAGRLAPGRYTLVARDRVGERRFGFEFRTP